MHHKKLAVLGALSAMMAAAFAPAAASGAEKIKPLWELGVMGGAGLVPDYPAAGQSHGQSIALPYVVYRGDILRAGDKGLIRGRFLHTDRVEFDVSLSGSFPADSEDNDARGGMPDLDWLGEVGPRLQITLARAARAAKIDLELPVRAVFSTDLSELSHRGFTFAPQLAYQHDGFGERDVNFKISLGVSFADQEMASYFYDVPRAYVAANRAFYSAQAGYMGSNLRFRAMKPFGPRWRMFAALEGNFHHGSANDQSPLFYDKTTMSFGVGLVWSFWQSSKRVSNGD